MRLAMPPVAAGTAVLTAGLLAVAGCDPAVPQVPQVPGATATLGTLPQLTDAQAAGLNSLPWEPVGSVSAGGKVMISVPGARCYDVLGSQARTSPTAVTLAVLGRPIGCRAMAVGVTVLVQLPGPLGTRKLAHAPVTATRSNPPG
jgi:hypothetical protein